MTDGPAWGLSVTANGLRVVAEYDLASRVTYCASELNMIYCTTSDSEDLSTFIFPAEEMTVFWRFLMRTRDTYRWSLSIAITRVPSGTTSILKLLEPLRRLHSLPSASITGPVSDEYKSILVERMLKQPDTDTAMQDVHDIMDQGTQASRNKDYSVAIAKYQRAVEDITEYSYWFEEAPSSVLKRGRFSGQTFDTAYAEILLDLKTKLAIAHLEIGSHSRAHEWIARALEEINLFGLFRACPGGAADAKTYSIAAQASEGLGLVERAFEEMKKAVWHDPGDSRLAIELVRLERNTGW